MRLLLYRRSDVHANGTGQSRTHETDPNGPAEIVVALARTRIVSRQPIRDSTSHRARNRVGCAALALSWSWAFKVEDERCRSKASMPVTRPIAVRPVEHFSARVSPAAPRC